MRSVANAGLAAGPRLVGSEEEPDRVPFIWSEGMIDRSPEPFAPWMKGSVLRLSARIFTEESITLSISKNTQVPLPSELPSFFW